MNRAILYIDILGFKDILTRNPSKVDEIFKVVDELKVHKHFALQTVVFSDTILVFNLNESHSIDYYCTYLIEYAQELFYKFSAIDIYYKAVLSYGEFNYSQLNNIQAYYGAALIEAYSDEKELEGFGLFINKNISSEVVVFDKIYFNEKFDYVLLCQSLKNLYSITKGILPIDINLLSEIDNFYGIDEDLRFFRKIQYMKDNHSCERVKNKYQKVYDIYKIEMPLLAYIHTKFIFHFQDGVNLSMRSALRYEIFQDQS